MKTQITPHRCGKLLGPCISALFWIGFLILQPSIPPRTVLAQQHRGTRELHALPGAPRVDQTPHPVQREEAKPENTQKTKASIGSFQLDLPDRVDVGTPFNMDIWIDFNDPNFAGSVKVFMEQTNTVEYEPRIFELKPGDRLTLKVTIKKAQSGLAMIIGYANGLDDLEEPLDAGFSVKLKPSNLDQALTSGDVTNVNFDFVNSKGEPVALDAPIKLTLQSATLNLRLKASDSWSDKVEFDVPKNYTASPGVQVKPGWLWSPNNGLLSVIAGIRDEGNKYSNVVHNENIKFNVVPRWWLAMVAAVIGGMILSLYQATQDWVNSKDPAVHRIAPILITRILPGALAGALAYFFVNLNILGIKIDTTALQGFLVLGFLFAYVGIDTILKLVTKKGSP